MTWPIVFVVIDSRNGEEVGRFEVHRDYSPVFNAVRPVFRGKENA